MIIQTLQVKLLDSFELGGKVWVQRGKRGVKTQTIYLKGTKESPPTPTKLIPEQGTLKSRALIWWKRH